MEDSVKDLDGDINPTTPEPRFSIGSKFLFCFINQAEQNKNFGASKITIISGCNSSFFFR